jgi:hypothetical protein
MIKFEAVIHPFFQEIKINGKKNMNEENQEFQYNGLDEWGGFEMFDRKFDYHFWYDDEPEFYIYDVTNDIEYGKEQQQDVKLIIEI